MFKLSTLPLYEKMLQILSYVHMTSHMYTCDCIFYTYNCPSPMICMTCQSFYLESIESETVVSLMKVLELLTKSQI